MFSFLSFHCICEEIKHKSEVNWKGFFFNFFKKCRLWLNEQTFLQLGPLYMTTLKEFENGGFTQKGNQMFCVHNTPVKFENAVIAAVLAFQ